MKKNNKNSYFSNVQDNKYVKIDNLSFEIPDYKSLKYSPAWNKDCCLDVLAHIKHSAEVYKTLSQIQKKEVIDHLDKIPNLSSDYSKEDYDNYWEKFKFEKKRLYNQFFKNYPETNSALQHWDKLYSDVSDLFKMKNFLAIEPHNDPTERYGRYGLYESESQKDPGKCKPLKLLKWAKESGYEIPLELEIIVDSNGEAQWLDQIAYGNIERTFPKHPTGKNLKNDPLYIAVKMRELVMSGIIKKISAKTVKQNLMSFLEREYHFISIEKRKAIAALVNDGDGHGGNRKKNKKV